jgi:hypothetical protein
MLQILENSCIILRTASREVRELLLANRWDRPSRKSAVLESAEHRLQAAVIKFMIEIV